MSTKKLSKLGGTPELRSGLASVEKVDTACGYIYVREFYTKKYEEIEYVKLGKTLNLIERDSQYVTSEIVRGHFIDVYEVSKEKLDYIEKLLMKKFTNYHIYNLNSGREFYKKKIIYKIEKILKDKKITYKKLSREEIENIERITRERKNKEYADSENDFDTVSLCSSDSSVLSVLSAPSSTPKIIPRKDQEEIINTAVKYFKKKDKGILVLPCGAGKTLNSLWVVSVLELKKIIIGVPNILLLKQWKISINLLFKDVPIKTISDGVTEKEIKDFVENNDSYFIITTYSSSYKLEKACKKHVFDMKILDEAHHLTAKNTSCLEESEKKKFVKILNVCSVKQISLTATLKYIEDIEDIEENKETKVISNDSIAFFGDIIDRKCLLWAIKTNIVCDFSIQTIIPNEMQLLKLFDKLKITDDIDDIKRMCLSAFTSLRSIQDGATHHLLIYANSTEKANMIMKFIDILINKNYFDFSKFNETESDCDEDSSPELYYNSYHSNMSPRQQREILDSFRKSKNGIISCVYCLGEGWDMPLLDGVVFAENMTSNIRIVQSALRASRINKNEIDKKTKIILPVLYTEKWLEDSENTDMKKIKEVIYQMSLEDETVVQKITVYNMNIEKEKKIRKKREEKTHKEEGDDITNFIFDKELTEKLKLRTTERGDLFVTYERAKKILLDKKINSKSEYFELCAVDCRFPEDPRDFFGTKFENWVCYLGINLRNDYYSQDTFMKILINKIDSKLKKKPETNIENKLFLNKITEEICESSEHMTKVPDIEFINEYYKIIDKVRDIKEEKEARKKREAAKSTSKNLFVL